MDSKKGERMDDEGSPILSRQGIFHSLTGWLLATKKEREWTTTGGTAFMAGAGQGAGGLLGGGVPCKKPDSD